jgi:DNA-binding MarR family transcriptional regulator
LEASGSKKDPDVGNSLSKELQQWTEATMRLYFSTLMGFVRSRNLNFPRMMMLFRLAHRGQCTVSDLSRHMEVSAPAASQLVDKLVEAGYVSRVENRDDRRIRNIEITPRGLKLVQELKNEHKNKINSILDAIPEEEQEAVQRSLHSLNVIVRSMQQHD